MEKVKEKKSGQIMFTVRLLIMHLIPGIEKEVIHDLRVYFYKHFQQDIM